MEEVTKTLGTLSLALLMVMYLIGSIPYNFFAAITYEFKYQSMMEEALARGHIKECPGVSDLRWDCNKPIVYADRSKPEKKDDQNVSNKPVTK